MDRTDLATEFTQDERDMRAAGAYYRSLPANSPERKCIESQTCDATLSNLPALCDYVDTMNFEDARWTSYDTKYKYQTIIYSIAGVNNGDSKDLIARKTREIAPAVMATTCHTFNFSQKDGNLLKYAIYRQFTSFIVDVAYNWQWGDYLNVVDASDGRTVLDYAYAQLKYEKEKNSSLVRKISSLILVLEKTGAKRANQLPSRSSMGS